MYNNFPGFTIFRQKLIDKIGENRLIFMCEKTGLEAAGAEGFVLSAPPERAWQSCYALCKISCFCRRGGYQPPANYGVAFRRAADSRPYIRKAWANRAVHPCRCRCFGRRAGRKGVDAGFCPAAERAMPIYPFLTSFRGQPIEKCG